MTNCTDGIRFWLLLELCSSGAPDNSIACCIGVFYSEVQACLRFLVDSGTFIGLESPTRICFNGVVESGKENQEGYQATMDVCKQAVTQASLIENKDEKYECS